MNIARLNRNRRRGIAAAQRLEAAGIAPRGFADLVGAALRPMTAAEVADAARAHAEATAAAERKAAVDREWKNMSFAEWSERRRNGTLPPKE